MNLRLREVLNPRVRQVVVQQIVYFVVPGDIETRTGGYRYDKRIIEGLRQRGTHVELISLCGDFPFPDEGQRKQAGAQLAAIPDNAMTVIDGLAYSVMPEQLDNHRNRLNLVALIHHPLAMERGHSREQAATLSHLEHRALQYARRVITTSPSTSASLDAYDVAESRRVVVCPGTDPAPLSDTASDGHFNLLCVATLTPRKGHSVLLDALAELKELPWLLACVGSDRRDHATATALKSQCTRLGLDQRVTFTGETDEAQLQAHYQQASLFVLASYHEGYGMVLDEAIAHGIPIIACDAGAIAQTVPADAGILVPSGDSRALADALRRFMQDSVTRESLQQAAIRARTSLRSWEQAAAEFHDALSV